MMTTTLVPPSAPTHHGTVPGWPVWTLRILVLLTTVAVFVHPVLAGLYLMGDPDMRGWHEAVGHALIPLLIILQIVAAILVWRPGRGPAWPIWASVGLLVLAQAQAFVAVMANFSHWPLAIHMPLGALIFGVMVALIFVTWSPRIRVRRSEKKVAGAAVTNGDEG